MKFLRIFLNLKTTKIYHKRSSHQILLVWFILHGNSPAFNIKWEQKFPNHHTPFAKKTWVIQNRNKPTIGNGWIEREKILYSFLVSIGKRLQHLPPSLCFFSHIYTYKKVHSELKRQAKYINQIEYFSQSLARFFVKAQFLSILVRFSEVKGKWNRFTVSHHWNLSRKEQKFCYKTFKLLQ